MSDLVAVAFYRVGYRPRESLVLVGLHGPRTRMGMVVRADLPPPRSQRQAISALLRPLRRGGDDQIVGLVVSDDAAKVTPEGRLRMPQRSLVRELTRQVEGQGMRLLDVLAVGPTHWRSYRCHDLTCCPAEGYPLEAAMTGPAAAQLVAEGLVLAADEEDLIADVRPVDQPADEATEAPGPREPVDGLQPDPADAVESLSRWRALLADPGAAGPGDLIWLTDVLEDSWVRDSLLLTLVPGSGTAPEEVLAGMDAAALDAVFESEPDQELLERGRTLLAAVARSAPAGRRADALALLAWAAWWAGEGARGRLLAQRALADVPGHRLAVLVDQLLLLGVVPGWVLARRPGTNGLGEPHGRVASR